MTANHKLTKVIAGRTIAGTAQEPGALTITFTDGSTMKVKVAPSNSNAARTGGTVSKVRQEGTTLSLDFTDGSSWAIETAEATSSVMLRDKNHVLEYAD